MIKLEGERSSLLTTLQCIVFSLNFLFYFFTLPFNFLTIEILLSLLTIFSIMLSVPFMKGLSFYLSIFFLVLGMTMQVSNGSSFGTIFFCFSTISSIIAFLGLIPILAIPIKITWPVATENNAYHIESTKRLFNKGQILSFSLSSIMNMGAIPMTWTFLEKSTRDNTDKQTMSTSITRGFALAMLWSPIGAGVAIVVEITGVSILTLIPLTIAIAILGLLLDRLLYSMANKSLNIKTEKKVDKTSYLIRNVTFVLPLFLFMTSTIVMDRILPYGILYIISVTTIPFTYIWSCVIRKRKQYQALLSKHIKSSIPKMYNQFGILLAAGFFVNSMQNEKFTRPLNLFFSLLKDHVGEGFLLIIGMASVIILSMTGVHQFVAITLIGTIIGPNEMGISPTIYSLGMLTALSIGIMVSPFNGTTALMSTLTKDSPFLIANWNLKYSFVFFSLIGACLLIIL